VTGWRVGYAFDFFDLENPQIGLPLVVTNQSIVIRATLFWKSLVANGRIKQTAQGDTIDIPAYTPNPTMRLDVIQDDKHPVAFQENGFASK